MTPLDRAVVTAVGMLTALGTAEQTCAAIRAGVRAEPEHQYDAYPEDGEGEPEPGLGVPVLRQGHRPGQVLRLFAPAMQDLVRSASLERRDIERTPLHLAVPGDLRFERNVEMVEGFVPAFYALVAIAPEATARVVPGGRAAALDALGHAVRAIEAGEIDACFVGGVDSHLDPDVIDALLEAGRLRRPRSPDGLLPGECAAVVLLERESPARARGARVLANVERVGVARELATVVRAVRAARAEEAPATGDTPEPVPWVVGDFNGEAWRAREWQIAREALAPALDGAQIWSPLAHLGDVGAGSGGLLLGVAAMALAGGYAPSDRALLIGASDDGQRAAALLSRATG